MKARVAIDTFWQHLEQVLQEYCEAATDDRRHGDAYMPVHS